MSILAKIYIFVKLGFIYLLASGLSGISKCIEEQSSPLAIFAIYLIAVIGVLCIFINTRDILWVMNKYKKGVPQWISDCFAAHDYTSKHKFAVRRVNYRLGCPMSRRRVFLHDIDKLVMYYFFVPAEVAHNIHVKLASHHNRKTVDKAVLQEMVIDWESARLTKPDKPLNAYDTMLAYYKDMQSRIEPVMEELGLTPGGSNFIGTNGGNPKYYYNVYDEEL